MTDLNTARYQLDKARKARQDLQSRLTPHDPEQWTELRTLRDREMVAEQQLKNAIRDANRGGSAA